MLIRSIKLVNFRNHSLTEFNIDKKIALFVGPNASGKSSIVDALAFLFTGTTIRTTKSGEGMDEMVTFGESRALVSAEVEGIGKITRSIPHDFQVADYEGTMTEQSEQLYKKLGFNKETLLCSVYSNKFIEMSSNDQKNFMFNLMGVKIDNESIQKEFMAWCKENLVENAERVWKLIEKNVRFVGPESFDVVLDIFTDMRKSLKKEMKNLEVLIKQKESNLPQGVTVKDKDRVLALLNELTSKRDELIKKSGNITLQMRLKKEYESKIEKAKTLKIPKETKEELSKKIHEYETNLRNSQKKIATLEAEEKQLRMTLANLNKFDGFCTLGSNIKCKMTKDDIKNLILKIENDLSAVRMKLEIENESNERLRDYGNNLLMLFDQRVQADAMMPDIDFAKRELEKINKDLLDNLDNNLEAINNELKILDERITKGQHLLMLIEAETFNEKNRLESDKKYSICKSQLADVEIIVNAFGPKGLKSMILNKLIQPLEVLVNERLKILTGGKYTLNFRIDDDDFNIYVISNGMERRFKHLSTSEKLRIGIIMQDAINEIAKTRLLVIDNAEILDEQNRKLFWGLIHEIKNNYDNILIFATGNEIKSTHSDVAGFLLGRKQESEIF